MTGTELKKLPTRRGDYYLPHFDLWGDRTAPPPGRGLLSRGDTVAPIGSCFARLGARYLKRRGYRSAMYPAGHLYNPATVRLELGHVLAGEPWPDEFILDGGDHFAHRFRKRCTARTREELVALDREISDRARAHLQAADLILVLVGTTTEVWRDEQLGLPTNEIPPPAAHRRGGWQLDPGDFDEIRESIAGVQRLLTEHTRAAQAYAVCPIPLHATWLDKGVLEANGRTKALLRAALELELTGDSAYLPLWDWMQGQTGRWSPMTPDGRHLDDVGTDRLMLFAEQFLSAEPVPPLAVGHRLRSSWTDLRKHRSRRP